METWLIASKQFSFIIECSSVDVSYGLLLGDGTRRIVSLGVQSKVSSCKSRVVKKVRDRCIQCRCIFLSRLS